SADCGRPKAEILAKRLEELARVKSAQSRLRYLNRRLDNDNIAELLSDADYVLDCTDSPQTKLLINDFCVRKKICFCYAGVLGRAGVLVAVSPGIGGCVRCLFGDFSEGDLAALNSCRVSGVIGAVCGFIGSTQANRALRALGNKGEKSEFL